MLDFRMQTFLTVCEEMNYTKAAERLHITQPAVSHHIHYLEQHYGCALFTFTGKKLNLTNAGKLLLNAMQTQQHDETRLMIKMKQPTEAPLAIGATLSVAEGLLQDAFASYLKQHPNRSITLTIDNTKTLLKSIDQGKLDVAFVEGYYAKDAYDAICYRKEPFLAVCAPSFPHWQSLTTLEDLLTCPLLLREEGSGSRAILERYLAEQNIAIHDFTAYTEIGSVHLIKELAVKGCGITFLYENTAKREIAEGSLVILPLKGMPLHHDITFLWRKHSQFADDYRRLLEEFQKGECLYTK